MITRRKFLASTLLAALYGSSTSYGSGARLLASDNSAAITGQTIVADGGFSAHTPSMNDMLSILANMGHNEM